MIYGYLFLILAVSQAAVYISGWKRLSLPIVALEIVLGIAMGETGLGWMPPQDAGTVANLQMLSQLGFILLMFVVGTHLPVQEKGLKPVMIKSGIATGLCFALALAAAEAIRMLTGFDHVLMITLILANSSAAVMMPMVHDKGLAGPTVLLTRVWVIFADAITIVVLPAALAPDRLANVGIGFSAIGALALGGFFALKMFRGSEIGQYYRDRSKALFHALDLKQALSILMGLAFVAYWFKISFLVPGFAAGAVAAVISEPRRFNKQLLGLGEGFLIPVFFVCLGSELNFRTLLHSPANLELALCIAVGTAVVHMVVATIIRLPLASGLAASAQLGLPAAVASLGLANGMLDSTQAAAIIAASMLSVLICTAGTLMLGRYSVAEPAPAHTGQEEKHDDHPGDND